MPYDYYFNMPKIELHAHLNGCLTVDAIRRLAQSVGTPVPPEISALSSPSSMEDVFKLFPLVQAVTSSYETVKQATVEVISEFSRENTVYLELRTTPKDRPGFSKKQYVQAVLDGMDCCSRLPIVVRLLLSVDRRQTVEEARQTVQMALDDRKIVGLDLSGDPAVDARKFLPLLHEAKRARVRLSIHLAEIDSCLEEVDEFLELAPNRIGHGTFLHRAERWVEAVTRKRIPLEICLTSNVLTSTTPTIANSHLVFWKTKGIPVAISTDDSGLMGTNLTKEYLLAGDHFGLDMADVVRDTLRMSFLDAGSLDYQKISKTIERWQSVYVKTELSK